MLPHRGRRWLYPHARLVRPVYVLPCATSRGAVGMPVRARHIACLAVPPLLTVSAMHEMRDKEGLVSGFVPAVLATPCLKKPGDPATLTMHDALSRGPAIVADVGCGSGNVVMALAEAYPHARFIGIDIQADSVAAANAEAARYGLDRGSVNGAYRSSSLVAIGCAWQAWVDQRQVPVSGCGNPGYVVESSCHCYPRAGERC